MDWRLRVCACAVAAVTGGCVVAVAAWLAAAALAGTRLPGMVWGDLPLLIASVVPAAIGMVVVLRRPRNLVAWIPLLGALSLALVMTADVVSRRLLQQDSGSTAGAWALLAAQEWPVLFTWQLALAYVFPEGRLPSPRWRGAAIFAFCSAAGVLLLLPLQRTLDLPGGGRIANPTGIDLPQGPLTVFFWGCWVGLLLSLFGGALALRARYRAGDAQQRRQVLWLAYGVVLLPLWLGGGYVVGFIVGWPDWLDGIGLVLIQVCPAVAVAIAVTRHGLWAIDRLLSRTLVYLVLTALLAGTYATVALATGLVLSGSAITASLATLAAALAFRPLRDRLQTAVDRRFSRARFEAVRLVRDFLVDVREGSAEPEDVGAVIAVALDDPSAEVIFRLPETGAYADRTGRVLPELVADGRVRSIIGRDQRELGLLLHKASPLRVPEVLRAVLEAAAVPVELACLRVELRLQLAEVESSRARIAQAGYDERRRIERDLHDGAQQRLVTLGIVLRRLQRSLPHEATVLVPAFDSAVDEVAAAISDLRTIAAGVRPPRLDQGLDAALADLARGSAVPVEVIASGSRAPADVEAAAYFVACEALTNAVKHASPSRVLMEAAQRDGVLHLLVVDDGIGGAAPDAGTGISGMLDRVAAHGGMLAIESPPGGGTRVAVQLPCGS
jgi:signal transduction histidine kinase